MAPQPHGFSGPMARSLLTTTGRQDVDLIPFPAQKMSMHEVPSYYGFRANNIARKCLPGATDSVLRQMHQPPTNLPEYTAKQAACLPDSYSKQEPNVRTLWPDFRMMVFPTKLIVHFATSKLISRSASPSHLKTWKSENNLRLCGKFLAEQLKGLFPEGDDTGTFIVPALRNGVGKPVFKLTPFGNGQVFELTAPDLCVPGIPDEVLQRVISPAGSERCGQCVMAALSPHRFFSAWRVGPFFAVSLSDGLHNLCSLWLATWPYRTQHLAPGKILCTNAVARTTPCRAFSLLPYGFGKANPY